MVWGASPTQARSDFALEMPD